MIKETVEVTAIKANILIIKSKNEEKENDNRINKIEV